MPLPLEMRASLINSKWTCSRVTGHLVFVCFQLSGLRVNRDLGIRPTSQNAFLDSFRVCGQLARSMSAIVIYRQLSSPILSRKARIRQFFLILFETARASYG